MRLKPVFDIVAEPKGQTYFDLLNFAASRCASFSLVWGDPSKFEQSAYAIKHALKPFLLSNDRTDKWPGTTLVGHEAIVRRYKVVDESVRLLHLAGALYSWLQPNLAEDLAFYGSDDAVWLRRLVTKVRRGSLMSHCGLRRYMHTCHTLRLENIKDGSSEVLNTLSRGWS